MKQFFAQQVSTSEFDGQYFQVMFMNETASEKAYLLLQRQFEMSGRGRCYIENHALAPCGHFNASAILSRDEFHLTVQGEEQWQISFEIDDSKFAEVRSTLKVILSTPNRLTILDT